MLFNDLEIRRPTFLQPVISKFLIQISDFHTLPVVLVSFYFLILLKRWKSFFSIYLLTSNILFLSKFINKKIIYLFLNVLMFVFHKATTLARKHQIYRFTLKSNLVIQLTVRVKENKFLKSDNYQLSLFTSKLCNPASLLHHIL